MQPCGGAPGMLFCFTCGTKLIIHITLLMSEQLTSKLWPGHRSESFVRVRCGIIALYLLLTVVSADAAVPTNNPAAEFYEAFKAEQAGKTNEAFFKYLSVQGGEFAAGTLAMRQPHVFLELLSNNPALSSTPRARLIQADLLAALGRSQEARSLYHKLATNIAVTGRVEKGGAFYFVEPVLENRDDARWGLSHTRPVAPFTYGPGSHRDNWLLRRLITMELKDDAAKEFTRMWNVHCGRTEAIAASGQGSPPADRSPSEGWVRAHPCGFSNLELQFILDYSYFLSRSDKTNESRTVLLEALELMDPDCTPKLPPAELPPAPPASGTSNSSGIPINRGSIGPAFFHSGLAPAASGTSQEDFCRLAYGEFKGAGADQELIGHLQRRIASGANHTRRVLAMIRRHRGEIDAALGLELEFLNNASFDPLTTACRRGVVLEDYQRVTNAIVEFENALSISPSLPEKGPSPLETYSVRDRLARLYATQGRIEKVLEVELAQFEIHETRADDFAQVEKLRQRFAVTGRTDRFQEWARTKLAASSRAATRANLSWQLGDFTAAAKEAAKAGSRRVSPGFPNWLERFEALGPEQHQAFLTVVVGLDSDDLQSRLDLLDLKGQLQSPAAATCYEDMLRLNRWSFYPMHLRYPKNPVEAAARLVRVYERAERFDDLRALGLKLAKRQPPFDEFEQNLYFYFGDNGRDEFVNATLGLAIQHAEDKDYQKELAAALRTSPWKASLAQLERRRAHEAGTIKSVPMRPAVKWANVPEGVELFVSCENVRSLAKDENFLYAGQPWGLAVYDFNGNLVNCVALGQPVTAMLVSPEGIWAGTPAGLFRLRPTSPGWDIALQAGPGINALVRRGDELWMANESGCRTLNVSTFEITSYSAQEKTPIQPQSFPLGGVDSGPLMLPDGSLVLGRGVAMDLSGHWDRNANKDESEGGLFLVSPKGVTNRISSAPYANILGGESVFKIVPVGGGYWVCTSRGVAQMNGSLQIVRQFSRKDGLLGNLITSATELGGNVYFGCSWDHRGGGLVVFDPATEVFTSFGMADGMDANRIEDLGTTPEGKLKITYAGETLVQGPQYRRSPPGSFDPKTHQFHSGGPPQPVSQNDARDLNLEWNKQNPFLGGSLLRKIELGDRTCYCGTRGMAVVQGKHTALEFARLGATEIPPLDVRMRAAAAAFDLRGWTSPEGVLRGLSHSNQFVRAKIIGAVHNQPKQQLNDYLPAFSKALDDSYERVRDNGILLLTKTDGAQALPALRQALKDSRAEIRVVAACELVKRGEAPPLEIFEEWLKAKDGHLKLASGYDSFTTVSGPTPASMTLAQMGTLEAAALCLKYPVAIAHTVYRPSLAAALGESVRKHPETADIWLGARGRDPNTRWPLPPFAKEVLQSAGKDLLPKLHQALTSTNRVIRSNAARACGAIGDPCSVSNLLAALDLESGLSRASIVWALGELKATNALPQLIALYTETTGHPSRPAHRVGFLTAQSAASYSAQFAALQDKNSIASEWQALSSPWPGSHPDDTDGDELLSVDHVLEAIRKAGPDPAQEFYRKLAGSARAQDRL